MHKYHVVLTDGSERDVMASDFEIREGSLSFHNDEGDRSITYAAGQWKMVELESRDDRD